MKFKCTQENLNQALGVVSHVAGKNVNLPILNNVLLRAKDNGLVVMATNLEIGVICKVRSKVEEDGAFTVPAQIFTNYVNLLNGENIEAELSGWELIVNSGKQNTKIKGDGADDFPIIPEVARDNRYEVDFNELITSFAQVATSASLDETRPEITGIFVEFGEQGVVLAATDSYRLAEKRIGGGQIKERKTVIIPNKTIFELIRIGGVYSTEKANIYLSDNQILFDLGDVLITSRLIEGEYPDYKQIIPKNFNTEAKIIKEEFIKAIKAASLFSKSGINDVELKLEASNKRILVSAINSQLGENQAGLEAEISGQDNDIVFNYKYLLDCLGNIKTDQVIVKLIDNANPGMFLPEGKDNFLYIIMPIKQ